MIAWGCIAYNESNSRFVYPRVCGANFDTPIGTCMGLSPVYEEDINTD